MRTADDKRRELMAFAIEGNHSLLMHGMHIAANEMRLGGDTAFTDSLIEIIKMQAQENKALVKQMEEYMLRTTAPLTKF